VDLDSSGLALTELFTVSVLLWLLIGGVYGAIIGILPALGSTVGIALALPLVVQLDTYQALAFLMSTIAVGSLASDYTSILFGIPGDGTSAALIVDGLPLTKSGQAGRALGADTVASFLGAIIGALSIAVFLPVLGAFILTFGTPEIFALTVVGACLIGVVSGNSVAKGILVAALGFTIATIGMDGKTGILRFTFGQLSIFDGLPLVPATVGLFAIPELIDLAVQRTMGRPAATGRFGGVLGGSIEALKRWALIVRCSLIAIFVGLIPGLGGGVSQWMAYAHAQQSSKQPEMFGKGAIDGVIGPGAANNAKDGGQMIPLLAFGIPGGSISAVLLGILLVLGLNPGPDMLEAHADVTLFLIFAMVLANILGVIAFYPLLKRLASLSHVKPIIIIPFITVMLVTAALGERGLMADAVVMMAFGIFGWFMDRVGWSRPALLLGFVLADRTENSLWISYTVMGFSWLLRPGVLILFGLAVVLVVSIRVRNTRLKRRHSPAAENTKDPSANPRPIYWLAETIVCSVLAVWGIAMLVMAREWPKEASLFPDIVATGLIGLCLLRVVQLTRQRPRRRGAVRTDLLRLDPVKVKYTVRMILWLIAVFVGVYVLGFAVAITVFVFAYFMLERALKLVPALVVTAVCGFGFSYLFNTVFELHLPNGLLGLGA
jgi:putative tricarboxylic transport membrane protein